VKAAVDEQFKRGDDKAIDLGDAAE